MELKTTAKGNVYQVVNYVDPFPGRKGTDRIVEECGKCSGTGHVNYGNQTWSNGRDSGRLCFDCSGHGKISTLVSSRRQTARRQAALATQENADYADWVADAPAREEAERVAAAEAAKVEAARLAAKPKGFIADEKVRVRDLNVEVAMVRSFEAQNYVTGGPELKFLVKFTTVTGQVGVWFTGNPQGLEVGDKVSLTGTVKKHDQFDGEDQTVLTRCICK